MAAIPAIMVDDYVSGSRDVDFPPDNGLVVETDPQGLEKVYDYEAGGHHPLHLHDVLHDRYRIIHKLGSGGYANVWLCRDITASPYKYVAVKVIMAEGSTDACPEGRVGKVVEAGCGQDAASAYLSIPLDQFKINGPNGTHLAFVYPVLGPRVSRLPHLATDGDPGQALRKICFDATQSMATLHAHGICHGDFRPANILTRVWGLDGLSEEGILAVLGEPKTTQVMTRAGESHDLKTAPQYLVYPVDWDRVLENKKEPRLTTGSACLTDFGESFEMDDPPSEVGIPQVYCSPEQVLEHKVGSASDLWALGCSLFEIRTGRKLFDNFDDDVDECLESIARILGVFPEPWWSETWERRRDFFEDDPDDDGKALAVARRRGGQSNISVQTQNSGVKHAVIFERPKARSLEDTIEDGLVYDSNYVPQSLCRDISDEETRVFADLLGQLLRYNPEERISAGRVLEHEWFKLDT